MVEVNPQRKKTKKTKKNPAHMSHDCVDIHINYHLEIIHTSTQYR